MTSQLLRCVYTGVSVAPRATAVGVAESPGLEGLVTLEAVAARMQCAPTKTFVKNVARIFAASECVCHRPHL